MAYSLYAIVGFFYSCANAELLNENQQKNNQTTEKLDTVQQAITQQKRAIALTNKKRIGLDAQLKKDELAIAKIAKIVNKTTKQLTQTKIKIKQLQQQKIALSQQKDQQQDLLAQQLRAAYSSGDHDYLKLILNQQKAASVQRTLSYYQYLNRARIDEIDNFKQTITSLAQVTLAQQSQVEKLSQLNQQQTEQKQQLKKSSKVRKKTLSQLNKQLLTNQQILEKLETQEKDLVTQLNKLQQMSQAELTLTGLSQLKHKLNWPVKGRLLKRFGSRKQGYLKWKGVLMLAPVGREVKSIHNGKILFADWLNGYGLVTVVDHGDGYMSLYGHNQALLKNVGDRVESGEPIALVGQSGGQNRAGLYFEIRHRGQAINPKVWCQ